MKKEISILGCGWLGTALALSFKHKGFVIKGSTTSTEKIEILKSQGIIPFLIRLNNLKDNITDFLSSEILIISIPLKNITDFKNLIYQIEISSLRKVIYISSTSVYGDLNEEVTENSPVKDTPLSNIEELFRKNKTFETTIIRFGGLFGYDRKPGNFIPQNKRMENPEGYVNLIHRDDCVRIIEQIVIKNIWNETLNACANSHPKRRDFYTKEALKIGRRAPIFNEDSLNEYKIVSSEKMKSMLNFSFKYPDLMNY